MTSGPLWCCHCWACWSESCGAADAVGSTATPTSARAVSTAPAKAERAMVVDLLVPEPDGRSLVARGVVRTTVGGTGGHVTVNSASPATARPPPGPDDAASN